MGFKLGANRGNYATGGEIKTKMRFGKQAGDIGSVPGTPVIRVPLDEGIMGEANMDGSIFVNEKIVPGSYVDRQVITHEMRHATDMKVGKLSYADNHIMYNGERFDRETINGLDMIKVDGQWRKAGDTDMPWEVDANNGGNGDI